VLMAGVSLIKPNWAQLSIIRLLLLLPSLPQYP